GIMFIGYLFNFLLEGKGPQVVLLCTQEYGYKVAS
ncbi:unnamed protein product, partial [marine sediment metagenome]